MLFRGILGSFDLLLLIGGITITFIISRCRRNWVRFDLTFRKWFSGSSRWVDESL